MNSNLNFQSAYFLLSLLILAVTVHGYSSGGPVPAPLGWAVAATLFLGLVTWALYRSVRRASKCERKWAGVNWMEVQRGCNHQGYW